MLKTRTRRHEKLSVAARKHVGMHLRLNNGVGVRLSGVGTAPVCSYEWRLLMGWWQRLPLFCVVNERCAIGVFGESAIDEGQYGSDRRQQRSECGRGARLAENIYLRRVVSNLPPFYIASDPNDAVVSAICMELYRSVSRESLQDRT
jgi:hypothetical protein